MSQYANALATEARFKATYTLSLAALEEAQGTLLEYDGIEVITGRLGRRGMATMPPTGDQTGLPAPAAPPELQKTPAANPLPQTKEIERVSDMRGGKGYSFQLSIKIGSLPIEIRGSLKPDRNNDPVVMPPIREGEATGVQAPPPLAAPSRN